MRLGFQARPRRPDELHLSAMVDVVFLLLIFFVLTFRIADVEGDFDIQMPSPGEGTNFRQVLPIHLRLQADTRGQLASISMNGVPLRDFDDLHRRIRQLCADEIPTSEQRERFEVLLDCDYRLDYQHTVHAIDAVSGYTDDNGAIVPLITNVKFMPARHS